MNNLISFNKLKKHTKQLLFAVFILASISITAQEAEYKKGEKYTIEEITVTGGSNFSDQTVITYSGLRKGQEIFIPGEKTSESIKKLWSSNLFSSIDLYISKVEGDKVYLEIYLEDLPEMNNVEIKGLKKGKIEEIITLMPLAFAISAIDLILSIIVSKDV